MEERGDFPLRGGENNGMSMSADVGYEFTTGHVVFDNVGDRPLRILRVKPEMSGQGLRYLGAMVAGEDRSAGLISSIPGSPPKDRRLGEISRLSSARLADSKTLRQNGRRITDHELLMGYRVVREGRTVVRGVTIVYTDGGTERQITLPTTLTVCVPDTAERCKADRNAIYRPTKNR